MGLDSSFALYEDKSFNCDECDYTAKSPSSVTKHKEAEHEGIRYFCDQCDYHTKQSSGLKGHMMAKHDGIIYD